MKKDPNQEGKTAWFWWPLLFLSFFFLLNNLGEFKRWQKASSLLKKREEKADLLEQEQRSLEEREEYVQGEDFVEKEAREKLGLAYPDKIRVLVPPYENLPTPTPIVFLSPFQQWWELFCQ